MSLPKSNINDDAELPGFDDFKDDKPSGAPARKEGRQTKKEDKVLPDFSDENDRTDALPSKAGISDDADRSSGARRRSYDAEDPVIRSSQNRQPKRANRGGEPDGLSPSKPKDVVRAEMRGEKAPQKRKKEDKRSIKKDETKASSGSARTVFIVCMIILSPIILVLSLAVILLFALVFTAAILIAGILALALIALVVAGVVLALTGITYGLIQMVSKSGFAFYAGQYELGLGLAITGITIILSSLLYAAATNFIPFIVKQLGRLLKFMWKKVKELFKKVYNYSTRI